MLRRSVPLSTPCRIPSRTYSRPTLPIKPRAKVPPSPLKHKNSDQWIPAKRFSGPPPILTSRQLISNLTCSRIRVKQSPIKRTYSSNVDIGGPSDSDWTSICIAIIGIPMLIIILASVISFIHILFHVPMIAARGIKRT